MSIAYEFHMTIKCLAAIAIVISSAPICQAQTVQGASVKYDKDAKIIYRPKGKPRLTKIMDESGYCCMLLDVDEAGQLKNIDVTYCTHDFLVSHFTQRVKKFRFSPALIDGQPVYRKAKIYRPGYVRYKGKYGPAVSGPNGYLEKKDADAAIPRRPRSDKAVKKWLKKYYINKKPCAELIS